MTTKLDQVSFTYLEVGATASKLPAGYQYLMAQRVVGNGSALFEECGETILNWGIQSGSGFLLKNSNKVRAGDRNILGLRWGLFKTSAPCQVVYVLDEPDRKGFAYGTITGHPERGEESFIVSMNSDGLVTFQITAFSQPNRWFARLGGPTIRFLQQHVTWKYLDSVHSPKIARNSFLAAAKRLYISPDKSAFVKTGGPNSHSQFE